MVTDTDSYAISCNVKRQREDDRGTVRTMKRILLLFFLALAAFGLQAQQQFDEAALLGEWTVSSQVGHPNNQIVSFSNIYLGDIKYDQDGDIIYARGVIYDISLERDSGIKIWEQHVITDFFISNGNKLHILINNDGYRDYNLTICLKIDKFTDDTLSLSSFDGTTQLVLTRKNVSKVETVAEAADETAEYYSLSGLKVQNPGPGLYIKRSGADASVVMIKE